MSEQRNRFFDGLFEEGGTKNIADYRYAGGNGDSESNPKSHYHRTFYEIKAPELFPFIDKSFPVQYSCVCGVSIKECCYVVNVITERTIVVGNCCILNFMEEESKNKCFECLKPVKHLRKKSRYICKNCKKKLVEKEKQKLLTETLEKLRKEKQEEQEKLFGSVELSFSKKKDIESRKSKCYKYKYFYIELVECPENYELVSHILDMYYNQYGNVNEDLVEYLLYYLDIDKSDDFKVIGKKNI